MLALASVIDLIYKKILLDARCSAKARILDRYAAVSGIKLTSGASQPVGRVLQTKNEFAKKPDQCDHLDQKLSTYGGPKGSYRRCDRCGARWILEKGEKNWKSLPPLPYPGATARQATQAQAQSLARSSASSAASPAFYTKTPSTTRVASAPRVRPSRRPDSESESKSESKSDSEWEHDTDMGASNI